MSTEILLRYIVGDNVKKYKNKRILISNGPALACDIVKSAKNKNIYTVVTDWYEDSPAKRIADKSYMVSTADIDAMVELAKKEKIDGVITSFVDSNLQNTRKVCEKLELPFYATEEQLEITMNKHRFKELCRKFEIPVVPEYQICKELESIDLLNIEYPVIVKPVDNSGSRGIVICNNYAELIEGYNKAMEHSESKSVLVERLMDLSKPGINIDYVICDGEIYLSAVGDLYAYQKDKSMPPLTASVYYPSKHTERYIQEIDWKAKNMFRGLGLQNGVLYIQAFYEDDIFYFYEMGYRLGGGQSYQVISRINGVNHLDMLIDYSLTGVMCTEETKSKISPKFNKKGFILILIVKPGTIQRITGLDKISQLKEVVNIMQSYKEGDCISDKAENTTQQVFGRVHIVAEDDKRLINTLNYIKEQLNILNENGESMLVNSFDVNQLLDV